MGHGVVSSHQCKTTKQGREKITLEKRMASKFTYDLRTPPAFSVTSRQNASQSSPLVRLGEPCGAGDSGDRACAGRSTDETGNPLRSEPPISASPGPALADVGPYAASCAVLMRSIARSREGVRGTAPGGAPMSVSPDVLLWRVRKGGSHPGSPRDFDDTAVELTSSS